MPVAVCAGLARRAVAADKERDWTNAMYANPPPQPLWPPVTSHGSVTLGTLRRTPHPAPTPTPNTRRSTLYMLACEYLIGAAKHDRIPTRR